MKKNKLLIPVTALVLAVAAYFLFFSEAKPGGSGSDAGSTEDSLKQADLDAAVAAKEKERMILMNEHTRPEEFLAVEIDPKKNLLGESIIEGEISNKASKTTYQDVELMIHWNDEAGMVLDSAIEVVFGQVAPAAKLTFKTKRKGPRKARSTIVHVRDAKVLEQ
jgi:hypothetical protein